MTPADHTTAIVAIHDWISASPHISASDYVNRDDEPARQAAQRRAYDRDRKRLQRDYDHARHELAEFSRHPYSAERLRDATAHAYSGRLQIADDGAITYEAAQDERREYRAAALAVLRDYNRLSRRAARRAELPPELPASGNPATPAPDYAPSYRISPPAD